MVNQLFLSCFALFLLSLTSVANADDIQQWGRFENSFVSTNEYQNPVQQVKIKVEFTSPDGTKRNIFGFWDGAKQWRVRFSPDQVGSWTYKTTCSDEGNSGLNNQTGKFECVKYKGNLDIFKHGELRISDNHRYIVHNDNTPFFWLADTVWCGPALSDFDDWTVFCQDRVEKEFTAIQFVMTQWRMTKTDADGNPTYTGKENITLNMKYFQRLDKYVDQINHAGLVAVPVLLWAIRGEPNPGYSLPEDQKIILAEYMIARYGAHQVIWFLGGDGNYSGKRADTWKRIGRAVFNKDQHRLATMHVGGTMWAEKEFRGEPWFDFLGYQSGHGDSAKTLKWLNQGPPSTEWNNQPTLPFINTEPNYEAHNGYSSKKAHNDHSVRRAAYWSLLVSPTAGVTYGGQGIWGWHTRVKAPADHISTGLGSPWNIAKDLPGAFSMKYLHQFFKSIDWWTLLPAQEIVLNQPGQKDPAKFIAAAKSKDGALAVIYLPEGGEVKLDTTSLKKDADARWYHPRTGGWLKADMILQSPQTFKTFDRNDWVLLIEAK
jgi:uncharacterized protein DUF4038/uncharacterized protein DUF5060/collagenase-like protein with putative collagen-binding domain